MNYSTNMYFKLKQSWTC